VVPDTAGLPPSISERHLGASKEAAMAHRAAREVMMTEVVTVSVGTPFKDIAAVLAERHISAVPVLDCRWSRGRPRLRDRPALQRGVPGRSGRAPGAERVTVMAGLVTLGGEVEKNG
jgi:hypothetical protein